MVIFTKRADRQKELLPHVLLCNVQEVEQGLRQRVGPGKVLHVGFKALAARLEQLVGGVAEVLWRKFRSAVGFAELEGVYFLRLIFTGARVKLNQFFGFSLISFLLNNKNEEG